MDTTPNVLTMHEMQLLSTIRPDQFTRRGVEAVGVDSCKVVEAYLLHQLPLALSREVESWPTAVLQTGTELIRDRGRAEHQARIENALAGLQTTLDAILGELRKAANPPPPRLIPMETSPKPPATSIPQKKAKV